MLSSILRCDPPKNPEEWRRLYHIEEVYGFRTQRLHIVHYSSIFILDFSQTLGPFLSAMSSSSQPLAGKVALVTGASRGIGAAVARRLASEGATVVVNYVSNTQAAEQICGEISAKGPGNAIAIRADVSTLQQGQQLVEETIKQLGQLDILVLNAGFMDLQTLEHINEEQYERHFNLNVKTPLFMARTAAPHMKAGKYRTCSSRLRS